MEEDDKEMGEVLQIKLVEKAREKEHLEKVCENLRINRAQIEEQKLKLYEDLGNQMSTCPRGQITLNFLLEETAQRCKAIANVLEKIKEEPEQFTLPEPEDEYTMMPYDDLVEDSQKLIEENTQVEQELQAVLKESKAAFHEASKEYEKIAWQTEHLSRYVFEIREEQAKLTRELSQPGDEAAHIAQAGSDESCKLTLAGLERQIREMYQKWEDELSQII